MLVENWETEPNILGAMNSAALSSLRFFAALFVVLFHNIQMSDTLKAAPKIFTAGPQMVTFFFVLSGFVLVLAYCPDKMPSLKTYAVKRLTRILPAYFIALALSVALLLYFSKGFSPVAFVLNLLLLQSWFPSYPLSINGPGWFLSDLVFFYAVFPVVLMYLKKAQPSPIKFIILCLFLWLCTQIVLTILLNTTFYKGSPSRSHALIFYFPLSHLCSFVLGMAGAYFFITQANPLKLSTAKSIVIMLFLLCLIVLLIENQLTIRKLLGIRLPFYSSFYAPLFLLLVGCFCVSDNFITSILSIKPLIILGESSFSVYILQKPVRIILHSILEPMSIPYDIFLLIYIVLLTALGILLLYTVDRPIRFYVKSKFD